MLLCKGTTAHTGTIANFSWYNFLKFCIICKTFPNKVLDLEKFSEYVASFWCKCYQFRTMVKLFNDVFTTYIC